MRSIAGLVLAVALTACGNNAEPPVTPETDQAVPPPIPADAETVDFERPSMAEQAAAEIDEKLQDSEPREVTYWGVKEGEALTLLWDDLLPEGSEDALAREYEEFYAMLEKRYAANTTSLVDAADPYAKIEEGSEFDFMPQLGTFDTVEELDGELVRIPGYVVPFDFDSDQSWQEFLFVPYMGACIHTPPPPPNQIIFVRADPAVKVKDIWAPYWLEGTLTTEKNLNDLGDTAYSMSISSIEPYPIP